MPTFPSCRIDASTRNRGRHRLRLVSSQKSSQDKIGPGTRAPLTLPPPRAQHAAPGPITEPQAALHERCPRLAPPSLALRVAYTGTATTPPRHCSQPDANPPAIAAEHGRGARAGLLTRCPARPPLASAYPPPHAPPSPCFASRHALRAAHCAIRGPQPPNAPLRPVAGLNRGSAPASEPTGAARAAALPALAALGPSRRSVGRFPPRLYRVWARVGGGGALRGLGAG